MKNAFLPFQIGEEYENWEMDLEILDVERVKGFDSYVYLEVIEFLGAASQQTELIFLWDCLQIVTLTFNFISLQQLSMLKSNLIQKYGERKRILNYEIYPISDDMELWLIEQPNSLVQISYGRRNNLNKLFLLC